MKSWCWPLTSGEFKYICPRARMFHALVTLRNLLLATSEYCSWGFSPYMTDQTTQEGSCPSSPRCLCADMFHKKKKEKGKWMCMRGWIALKTCNFLLVLWFSEDTRPQIYIVYLCLNSDRNYKLLSGTCKLHIQNRQVAAYHKSAANSSCLI